MKNELGQWDSLFQGFKTCMQRLGGGQENHLIEKGEWNTSRERSNDVQLGPVLDPDSWESYLCFSLVTILYLKNFKRPLFLPSKRIRWDKLPSECQSQSQLKIHRYIWVVWISEIPISGCFDLQKHQFHVVQPDIMPYVCHLGHAYNRGPITFQQGAQSLMSAICPVES